MNDTKLFFFNSLSFTVGLIFYTIFLYILYYLFLKEKEENVEKENVEKENVEKENLDNFDVLEDID